MHYPGISISFELPKNFESIQEQLNPSKIPFEVGGEHLLAKRILIYESSLNVNNPKQNQIVLKEPEYQPPYFILAEVFFSFFKVHLNLFFEVNFILQKLKRKKNTC